MNQMENKQPNKWMKIWKNVSYGHIIDMPNRRHRNSNPNIITNNRMAVFIDCYALIYYGSDFLSAKKTDGTLPISLQ